METEGACAVEEGGLEALQEMQGRSVAARRGGRRLDAKSSESADGGGASSEAGERGQAAGALGDSGAQLNPLEFHTLNPNIQTLNPYP